MLAILLIWLYIFILSFTYGVFCLDFLRRLFRIQHDETIPIVIIAMLGLCILTVLTGLLTLAMPLSLFANLLLLLGGIVIIITNRKRFSQYLPEAIVYTILQKKASDARGNEAQTGEDGKPHSAHSIKQTLADLLIWYLGISRFLVVLSKTSEIPQNYDTGLYHAQAIRWIETFRTVPGLGNLESRLAFNSAWFLPSALFSFSFLNLQSFHVLNGFFFLLVNIYFLGKLRRFLRHEFTLSNIISIPLIYISFRLFGSQLSSPGSDLPATLLTWIIFLLALEKIESGKSDLFDIQTLLILLLSVFDVIVKISSAPILLLPLYFLARILLTGQKVKPAFLFALGGVVLIPWIARGVILSGYLLFPITMIDLFTPDWKMPSALVKLNSDWITSWARLHSYDSQMVLSKSFAEWLPLWWGNQLPFDRLILLGIGIGTILFVALVGLYLILDKNNLKRILPYAVIFMTGWIGIGYWFITAPDVRFGYGFLVISLCFLTTPIVLLGLTQLKWTFKPLMYSIILVLILYQAFGIYKLHDLSKFDGRWLLPVDYPTIEVKAIPLGNFIANTPVRGYQCWYAALPCTEMNLPDVYMRGDRLQDGFYSLEERSTRIQPP
jgi:hypothetical protein